MSCHCCGLYFDCNCLHGNFYRPEPVKEKEEKGSISVFRPSTEPERKLTKEEQKTFQELIDALMGPGK